MAMADYTVKRFNEMDALRGGALVRVRASLGASAFGMQLLQMPPNATYYPEHDHNHDGQEEVYIVIEGSGEVDVDGERISIEKDLAVRVGPRSKRKLLPGSDGMRLIVVGATPGAIYEPPEFTEIGGPDPMELYGTAT